MADALNVTSLEIAGVGISDGLAAAAATADPRLLHTRADLPGYTGVPGDLIPEQSGAHLFRAWHWLREQFLARDEPPPDPVRLTRMVLDLIDARVAHRTLWDTLDAEAGADARSEIRS